MTQPSSDIIALAEARLAARINKDWSESDRLRDEIAQRGWKIVDTSNGYDLVELPPFTVLSNVTGMVDNSHAQSTSETTLHVLVDGWPGDVETFCTAFAANAPGGIQLHLIDCGNVDSAGLIAERFAKSHSQQILVTHLDQTLPTAGWATVLNAAIKNCTSHVQGFADMSSVISGDAFSPLVAAIQNGVVLAGWRGVNVDVEDNWRSFVDADKAGECDAVLSYLMFFARDAALKTPLNPKAKFYRNADLEWSLMLRNAGGKVVMPEMSLPCAQTRHHGYHDSEPEYRERESKKTYDRILQGFRSRPQILAPRPQ
jgi:hypothetical protein